MQVYINPAIYKANCFVEFGSIINFETRIVVMSWLRSNPTKYTRVEPFVQIFIEWLKKNDRRMIVSILAPEAPISQRPKPTNRQATIAPNQIFSEQLIDDIFEQYSLEDFLCVLETTNIENIWSMMRCTKTITFLKKVLLCRHTEHKYIYPPDLEIPPLPQHISDREVARLAYVYLLNDSKPNCIINEDIFERVFMDACELGLFQHLTKWGNIWPKTLMKTKLICELLAKN